MEKRRARAGLTFLFTDIEGSTQLIQELGSGYSLVVRVHQSVLEAAADKHGGRHFGSEGDALFFVFPDPAAALAAALVGQRRLAEYAWPDGIVLRVRMGLATGPATIAGGEYVGLAVHEVARVCAAAHGAQILCSSSTTDALVDGPPEGVFRDLGAYWLRNIAEPRRLLQLCVPDLEHDFPPPREALRQGGSRVTIWRRHDAGNEGGPVSPAVELTGVDGAALPAEIDVEVRRASSGTPGAFRLIVRRAGQVEEEFDGLTHGGADEAAEIVNAHSRFIRVTPAGEGAPARRGSASPPC